MKFLHVLTGISLALAVASCGTTKTASANKTQEEIQSAQKAEKAKHYDMQVKTDQVLARKRKMTEKEIQQWPHMDIYKDSVPGMSLDKAYEFLSGKKAEPIIVAVIDSGIDIEHEDLNELIWTNEDEIPNNNIDDDKNGYIDDIHGWNFLGGKEGSSAPEQLEITRMVKKLASQMEKMDEKEILAKEGDNEKVREKIEHAKKHYMELKDEVDKEREDALKRKVMYTGLQENMKKTDAAIKKALGKDTYTLEDLTTFNSGEESTDKGKEMLMKVLASGMTVEEGIKQLQGAVDYFTLKSDYHYNIDFSGRVTGDNPDDFNDVPYGNNWVIGSKDDEIHGTHVSGIIMAERNNGIGMNGVTNNVALMCVRTVPDGDEYDKDVAHAIRYAVDNGAKVINMSFGKSYSPHKYWVFDAIKYAEEHDVLLVHAAGNDNADIDVEDNFPNDSKDKLNEFSDNVITVGAMTRHFDENLVASFSNYGKKNVDIFAPGLEIYSTFPKNEYESIQGTSMASPEVAGVAALVRSYYPNLSASEVKHIIMDSGIEFNRKVKLPASRGSKPVMVDFNKLSVSGKILNAYNAVVLADKISKAK